MLQSSATTLRSALPRKEIIEHFGLSPDPYDFCLSRAVAG
jgi:hypothetical protein